MKRTILIISATCAMLATGCARDNNDDGSGGQPGTVKFVISTEAAALATRAGFYSEENPTPDIPSVDVYVFQHEEGDGEISGLFSGIIHIEDFVDSEPYVLMGEERMIVNHNYIFVPVGRVADNVYDIPEPELGVDWYTSLYAHLPSDVVAGDIYGGLSSLIMTAEMEGQDIVVNMEMKRKVAGILGYFSNVPSVYEGKDVGYLRLNQHNWVNRGVRLSLVGMGDYPEVAALNSIWEIDLREDTSEGGVFTGNDVDGDGIEQLPGTYLKGGFAIPAQNVLLTLDLMDITGTEVLRSWPIEVSENFDIRGNVLHRMGQKKMAANTNGGTPDILTDDDKPFDLMDAQRLTINIDYEWEDTVILFKE